MFSSRCFGKKSVETEQKKVIDQDWIYIDCETPVIALPDRVITGHLTVRVDPMFEAVQFPVEHVVNQFCVSTTNVQLPEHIVNENISYPCHLQTVCNYSNQVGSTKQNGVTF